MRRQPVSSSIQSVGYDPQRHILGVKFHGNGIYQYEDVSQDTYAGLMAAPSKGQYFAERIRDRYAWRRLSEHEVVCLTTPRTNAGGASIAQQWAKSRCVPFSHIPHGRLVPYLHFWGT